MCSWCHRAHGETRQLGDFSLGHVGRLQGLCWQNSLWWWCHRAHGETHELHVRWCHAGHGETPREMCWEGKSTGGGPTGHMGRHMAWLGALCGMTPQFIVVVVPQGTWGDAKGDDLDSLCCWCRKEQWETKREMHELQGTLLACVWNGWT